MIINQNNPSNITCPNCRTGYFISIKQNELIPHYKCQCGIDLYSVICQHMDYTIRHSTKKFTRKTNHIASNKIPDVPTLQYDFNSVDSNTTDKTIQSLHDTVGKSAHLINPYGGKLPNGKHVIKSNINTSSIKMYYKRGK